MTSLRKGDGEETWTALPEDSDCEFPDLLTIFEEHAQRSTAVVKLDTISSGVRPRNPQGRDLSVTSKKMEASFDLRIPEAESATESRTQRDALPKKCSSKRRVLNKIYDNPLLRPINDVGTSAIISSSLQRSIIRDASGIGNKKTGGRRSKPPASIQCETLLFDAEIENDSSGLSDFIVSDGSYVDGDEPDSYASPSRPRPRRRLVQRRRVLDDSSSEDEVQEISKEKRPYDHTSTSISSTPGKKSQNLQSRDLPADGLEDIDQSGINEQLGILRLCALYSIDEYVF